ncbi:MAG: penicillin-binding transpeptidase domain-containing protein, partial [Rikenellaceae bacterium]
MSKKRLTEKQRVERDILRRVHLLYAVFITIAIVITVRLVWIQISPEVAHNTRKLENKVFRHHTLLAHRGSILAHDGEPLATSIFRYQVEMDYGSDCFDSLELYKVHVDSLSKLLSIYFKDRSAAQYKAHMLGERSKHYSLVYLRDSLVRHKGWWARVKSALRGDEDIIIPLYDTIRDNTLVPLFPRYVNHSEWEELRRYPILNWNMGMSYNLASRDDRVYPQGELARRTIGKLLGDRGTDYGIEGAYSQNLAGQDGLVLRQRIARGFYGNVSDDDNIDPVDGEDVVTTLDIGLQDFANRALYEQLTRHKALWGTTVVMDVETGDILAMVNLGRSSGGGYIEDRNYAIGSRMEPGSTFKLATMIALLEDAKMSVDKEYDSGDGAYISVGHM